MREREIYIYIYTHTYILQVQIRALGANHIDVAGTKDSLGVTLWRQGKFQEALKLYDEALQVSYNLSYNSLGLTHIYNCMTITTHSNCTTRLSRCGSKYWAQSTYLWRRPSSTEPMSISGRACACERWQTTPALLKSRSGRSARYLHVDL